jgi:hypothetical protein
MLTSGSDTPRAPDRSEPDAGGSGGCSSAPGFHLCDPTTRAIPPQRSCSAKGCIRSSSPRCSATPPCRSLSTSTATPHLRCIARRRAAWMRCFASQKGSAWGSKPARKRRSEYEKLVRSSPGERLYHRPGRPGSETGGGARWSRTQGRSQRRSARRPPAEAARALAGGPSSHDWQHRQVPSEYNTDA